MLHIEGPPGPCGGPTPAATRAAARAAGVVRAARAAGVVRAARAAGVVRAARAANAARATRAAGATRVTVLRAAAAACAILVGGGALAGCAQKAAAAASLQIGNAFVEVPSSGHSTAAYLVIQNKGSADRLTSARTSVGGRVTFREPVRSGGAAMKTVPDIIIPADSLVRLTPDGSHLLITGAGPMKGGTQITLTLVFAQGGTMSVAADVTNPASGGSSYFLD